MAVIKGTSMLVLIDGVSIGATTSCTLNISSSNIETSNKGSAGHTDRISGKGDWSVDFDGLYDPSQTYGFQELYDQIAAKPQTRVVIEIANIDGTGGGELYRGFALCSSATLTAPNEEASTISGTFEADGILNKGTVASS